MKKTILITLICVGWLSAYAQQKVTGTVISGEDNLPLPGVTVVEEGTQKGTITRADGTFEITVGSSHSVLIFTSIGMQTVRQVVGNSKTFYITMQTNVKNLDEVVVIGYGTSLRKDLTGSISSVQVGDIQKSSSGSVLNTLSGKIAGLDAVSSSGEPGADVNINIRGANSVNAGTQPLYVIDGTLIDVNTNEVATSSISGRTVYNPLSSLNPADIESIQVLKDASATSIYGSAGANGVIIITTKQGSRNETSVNFDSRFGFNTVTKHLPMLGGQQFADYRFSRFSTSMEWGMDLDGDNMPDRVKQFPSEFEENVSHDWQKELMRTAFFHNYNLGVSGNANNNKLIYSTSLEYLNQEAIVRNNNFKRYSGRYKIEYAPNAKLKLGTNAAIVRTELYGPVTVGGGEQFNGLLESLLIYKPYNFKLDPADPDNGGISNPELTLFNSYKKIPLTRVFANAFVQFKPIPELTVRSSLNTGLTFSKSEEWYPSVTSWGYARKGLANLLETSSEQWQSTTTADYRKNFKGGHHLNVMLGIEATRYTFASLNVTAENFSVQSYNPVFDLAQAATLRNKPNTNKYQESRFSGFGRLYYSLKDKYLLTLTMRNDGSSKFGKDSKYALFPSAALAWKMHNEPFLKENKNVDELKLRLSVGSAGNDRIPAYRSLSRLNVNYYANIDGTAVLGLAPSELPNPKLKWEKTDEYNVGLDVSLFKGRFTLTLDAYYKLTRDMLLLADVAGQTGSFKQWQNIGEVENKGVELAISSVNVKTKDFTWGTSFNISTNKNKIRSLGSVTAVPVSIQGEGAISEVGRLKVGEAIGCGWGYLFDGVYQTDDFDASGDLKPGIAQMKGVKAKPGDMKFKDLNGDYEIDPINDKDVISRAEPLFYGGLNNYFTYKNFDLSFFFNFSYGKEVMNIGRWKYEGVNAYYNMAQYYYDGQWTLTNPTNDYPAVLGNGKTEASSYYVEDASFIRLQNVTLGYTVPVKYLKGKFVRGLRLSAAADNLFVLTKYTGFDPEVSYWNPLIRNLDNVAYPRSRSFSFAVNITL